MTIKNSDFDSVAIVSFLKGLTHEFGKKGNEISPLDVFEQDWPRNNVWWSFF